MTAHDHLVLTTGCFRCNLGSDEARDAAIDTLRDAASAINRDCDSRGRAGDPEAAFMLAVAVWLSATADGAAARTGRLHRFVASSRGDTEGLAVEISPEALFVAQTYLGELP